MQRQLVDQRDVDVALGVLDHLGGLGHRMLDALCVPAVMIVRVQRVDEIGDFRRRAGGDLPDRRQAMFLVARIDALGAVAGEEILVELEAGDALEDRHADFLGAARIDGGFVDHDVALLQHLADGFAGALPAA